MRIALIAPFALEPKGTTSGRVLPMASALARRGHQVLVVVPPWDDPAYSGTRLVLEGVELRHTPLPSRFPPLWYPLVTWRTLCLAIDHRPEVLHVFKPKAFSGLAAMAHCAGLKPAATVARTSSPRLVVDTDDWEGPGGWNEIGPYGPLQRAFFAFQEKWVLRHAEAVTVASRALASMAGGLGVPAERIFYLPNGATGDEGGPPLEAVGRDASGPTLLLYTRFFEFQPQRVVSIFRRVLAQVPEARLLVLGKGLRGEELEMGRLLEEAALRGMVEMVGWVQQDQLAHYFRRAHVALYPLDDTLLNRAKCPLKLVELMEAGFPVVADNVGQASEYIVDGQSGLLVEAGNEAAFASRVVRLLQDPQLRRKLGQAARDRILGQFHWDHLVQVAEEAYGL